MTKDEKASPFPSGEDKDYVYRLFSDAAPHYDRLNSVLSFYLHKYWRRFAISKAEIKPSDKVIDVCAGTADLSILAAGKLDKGEVKAVDFCPAMLDLAREKIVKKHLDAKIDLVLADACKLPFPEEHFDKALIGFGIRNIKNRLKAFEEMFRVLKKGGRLVCLEFGSVNLPVLGKLYALYSEKVIPQIGRIVAKTNGYQYLTSSIEAFPSQEQVKSLIAQAGFNNVRYFDLNLGIAVVYVGEK